MHQFAYFFIFMMIFAPLYLLVSLLWKILFGHNWKYHNPYDRTCKTCKLHEVMYQYPFGGSAWEEMNEVDTSIHYKFKRTN